jgi:hypothetical protein
MDSQMKKTAAVRRPYRAPQLKRWGTVGEITLVGRTNPGQDVWPGAAPHPPGSIVR